MRWEIPDGWMHGLMDGLTDGLMDGLIGIYSVLFRWFFLGKFSFILGKAFYIWIEKSWFFNTSCPFHVISFFFFFLLKLRKFCMFWNTCSTVTRILCYSMNLYIFSTSTCSNFAFSWFHKLCSVQQQLMGDSMFIKR